MLSFLRAHPLAFSLVFALLVAVLVWLYERTVEPDANKVQKTFNKTLAAGVLAGVALTWLVNRQEPVSCEPFVPE